MIGTLSHETAGTSSADAASMNPPDRSDLLLLTTGLSAPALAFAGAHLLHPAGRPEQMPDADIVRWAESAPVTLWIGGTLGLAAALLLLVWGSRFELLLGRWEAPAWCVRTATFAVVVTAALQALAALVELTAGVVSTPSEATGSVYFLPNLVLLCSSLLVTAWCLMAPVALAVAMAARASGWVRACGWILGVALGLSLALPFVSWAPAFLLVALVSVAGVRDPARATPADGETRVTTSLAG